MNVNSVWIDVSVPQISVMIPMWVRLAAKAVSERNVVQEIVMDISSVRTKKKS